MNDDQVAPASREASKPGYQPRNRRSDATLMTTPPRIVRIWRQVRRQKQVLIGGAIILVFVFAAIFANLITTNSPTLIDPRFRMRSPNEYYFFGTDSQGRDVFARVVFGARLSLKIGFSTSILTLVFGTVIGLVAGYYRRVDGVIMRITDAMMAFPGIILAIAIMAVRGASVINVIFALTIVAIPRVVRLVRSLVIGLRESLFVESAIASGCSSFRVVGWHVLPNTVSPLIVQMSFVFAEAVLAAATLSFLGAGAPPEIPSWGIMLADSQRFMNIAPWTMFFPAAALALTVLGLNLLGDGLRDMLDPRLRQR
jgi:peptide/nickel transport system permease protein